jgi:DNA-binding NtrC family response regulator
MPEMDGWETARAIRKSRPGLPVVLVTGYGATAQPPSGELDLVAGIIGKPFDFDQVTGTIARVVTDHISQLQRLPKPSQLSRSTLEPGLRGA